MPQRSDWIQFEGVWATRRGANMVIEAWRLFKARTGKPGPGISQGGLSNSVGASGGTHSREAFDFRTASYSPSLCRVWEECLWEVGFAAWWRPYIFNLWPQHHHAVPKGGDLSVQAGYQVSAFKAKRNGLKSNLKYPRITTAWAFRTWEQYLKSKPKPPPAPPPLGKIRIAGKLYDDIPALSLYWLTQAWDGTFSRHTFWFQKMLTRTGHYRSVRDGKNGPVTKEAWTAFCRANKLADGGAPKWTSLKLLKAKARSFKPIKKGK